MKQLTKCVCGSESFKLTDITDNYGDSLKLKICTECGNIWERD